VRLQVLPLKRVFDFVLFQSYLMQWSQCISCNN
jgi:hypothetical protein